MSPPSTCSLVLGPHFALELPFVHSRRERHCLHSPKVILIMLIWFCHTSLSGCWLNYQLDPYMHLCKKAFISPLPSIPSPDINRDSYMSSGELESLDCCHTEKAYRLHASIYQIFWHQVGLASEYHDCMVNGLQFRILLILLRDRDSQYLLEGQHDPASDCSEAKYGLGKERRIGRGYLFPALSLSSVSSPFPLLSPLDVVAASVKQPQGPVDGRPALC